MIMKKMVGEGAGVFISHSHEDFDSVSEIGHVNAVIEMKRPFFVILT